MRLRSIATAVFATVALVVPSGATASAATPECSIVAPTKIAIDREYREVPLQLTSSCAASGTVYAAWDVMHSTKGWQNVAIFENATTAPLDVYDFDPTGSYTLRPAVAFRANYSSVTQNTATTRVKLGSRLPTTITRPSGRLTFTATARTWSPRVSAWSSRANATVSLRYQAPGTTTWTWVKDGTTSSTGQVTLSVTPKSGKYRLVIGETATAWGATSITVSGL